MGRDGSNTLPCSGVQSTKFYRTLGTGLPYSRTLKRCAPKREGSRSHSDRRRQSETFAYPAGHAQTEIPIVYNASVHGMSGPIITSYPPFLATSFGGFYDALRGLGINIATDMSSGDNVGVSMIPSSIDPSTNTRVSSDAYRKNPCLRLPLS